MLVHNACVRVRHNMGVSHVCVYAEGRCHLLCRCGATLCVICHKSWFSGQGARTIGNGRLYVCVFFSVCLRVGGCGSVCIQYDGVVCA